MKPNLLVGRMMVMSAVLGVHVMAIERDGAAVHYKIVVR